jgi:hypothetical protein
MGIGPNVAGVASEANSIRPDKEETQNSTFNAGISGKIGASLTRSASSNHSGK